MIRNLICWMMLVLTPATLLATDPSGAMLYGRGPVLLNGKPVPKSSAVFPGDLIQTQSDSLGNLDISGSAVTVLPDSLVKFDGSSVEVEHGSVSVATSHSLVATEKAVTVTPVSDKWTKFELGDASGALRIVADKGEINVNCGKDTATLSEGDQVSTDESGKCNKKRRTGGGAPMPANGRLLTNPFVLAGAAGTAGGVICLLLCNSSKPFVSQWKP